MKPFLFIALAFVASTVWSQTTLKYVPAPPDNPLKGLVPYARPTPDRFPHSMEFNYLPLSDLMTGPETFNWQPLEDLLDDIASRRHQTVFRIWLEYPGHSDGVPKFLEDAGVKVTEWLNTNTARFPPKKNRTPDYEDPRLRSALQSFIAALGERYDGDSRIGYITAGLLGTWGEWHTYPKTELMASKEVQAEVMDGFEKAFQRTPVLLRYPAGDESWAHASNHQRRLGYHDDSFAWATLDTGMFEKKQSRTRINNAIQQVQKMGYEFHIVSAETKTSDEGDVTIRVQIQNTGNAPFYHDWKVELMAMSHERMLQSVPVDWTVSGLLPDEPPRSWTVRIPKHELPPSATRFAVRIANPMPKGMPLRFANEGSQRIPAGWLELP